MEKIDKIWNDKALYDRIKEKLEPMHLENFQEGFRIEYTHNSTAIEGNSLTLIDTKLIISDHISIGGKDMREIHEVINHDKAFHYVQQCTSRRKPLSEDIVKQIHKTLMENIFVGGNYRTVDVMIGGSRHEPPTVQRMIFAMKDFYKQLEDKCMLETTKLAAWTHAQFVNIHPFVDGNGRTARLLMNYQLMDGGLLPISIQNEDRQNYYKCLEEYHIHDNLQPFHDMVMELEEKQLHKYLHLAVQEGLLSEKEVSERATNPSEKQQNPVKKKRLR